MDKMSEKCSTPEYGHKNISLNFSLSEIQGDSINDQLRGFVSPIEKKSTYKNQQQQQQPGKNIHDPFSDSEYETVDVREILFQDCLDDDETSDNIVRENVGDDNASPLSMQLFRSPRVANFDDDAESYSDLLEDIHTASISHDPITSSPEFQLRFRYPTQFKTYARPAGIRKRKLSPSNISFSPKWVKRIPSKYSSPSQIPFGNSSSVSWSFEKEKTPAKKPRSKYTHLQVESKKFKKSLAPNRKLGQSYMEVTYLHGHVSMEEHGSENSKTAKIRTKDRSKSKTAETSLFGNNSKLLSKKRIKTPRYDLEDSAIELEESLEANGGLSVTTNHDNISNAKSAVQKKSKPRIVSVEIISKARVPNL